MRRRAGAILFRHDILFIFAPRSVKGLMRPTSAGHILTGVLLCLYSGLFREPNMKAVHLIQLILKTALTLCGPRTAKV